MPKNLQTPFRCQDGVFQDFGHNKVDFVASLWAPFWPSFNHIIWFFWIGHHPSRKAFNLISFEIVLASLKGCLLPSLLGLVMCLGGNQGGVTRLVVYTPNQRLDLRLARRICWGGLGWWPFLNNQNIWFYDDQWRAWKDALKVQLCFI